MSEQECLDLLYKYIINQYDYQRMVEYDCDSIMESESYDNFLDWNIVCIKTSSTEEKIFFKLLCDKIKNKQIGQMDLETCCTWDSDSLFFDKNKNIIVVHPR